MANTLRMGSRIAAMAALRARPRPQQLRALSAWAVSTTTTTTTGHLDSRSRVPRPATRRFMSSFDAQPAPPRLPPEEQAEFERLLKAATESVAAAELADAVAAANAEAAAVAADAAAGIAAVERHSRSAPSDDADTGVPKGTSGNPVEGVWRGAPPEFEGDRNPKTGEVGGPKNEPLRWGSDGDWSFNGRVTDF